MLAVFTRLFRSLPLALLLALLPMAVTQAQTGAFSLPGIADLEKQLSGDGSASGEGAGGGDDGASDTADANPEREALRQTLTLRREIDSNRDQIDTLSERRRQAPAERRETALDDAGLVVSGNDDGDHADSGGAVPPGARLAHGPR